MPPPLQEGGLEGARREAAAMEEKREATERELETMVAAKTSEMERMVAAMAAMKADAQLMKEEAQRERGVMLAAMKGDAQRERGVMLAAMKGDAQREREVMLAAMKEEAQRERGVMLAAAREEAARIVRQAGQGAHDRRSLCRPLSFSLSLFHSRSLSHTRSRSLSGKVSPSNSMPARETSRGGPEAKDQRVACGVGLRAPVPHNLVTATSARSGTECACPRGGRHRHPPVK